MGRKKKKTGFERFVKLPFYLLEHPSWRALTPVAKLVFIELKHRYNGVNNGQVALSCRDAGELLGCSRNTAQRALLELEYYGFIILRWRGTFGNRKASEYILTCEGYNNHPPTHEWKSSRPDFKTTRPKSSDLQSHQSTRNANMEQQIVSEEGL